MTNWPALDLHAHIDAAINPQELLNLRAVIFAASRSLKESQTALSRQTRDLLTVWGVGVHPGLKSALDDYDPEVFNGLIDKSACVSEIGLDAKAPSRLGQQHEVLESILSQLQQKPRLTSIHSYGTSVEIVDKLNQIPITGAILHWWLGDKASTIRALDLGAYFSINASNLRHSDALELIPTDRLLLETDHPDGNRGGRRPRQPGSVSEIEIALAQSRGLSAASFRLQLWKNLASLVMETDTKHLLPPRVAAIADVASSSA